MEGRKANRDVPRASTDSTSELRAPARKKGPRASCVWSKIRKGGAYFLGQMTGRREIAQLQFSLFFLKENNPQTNERNVYKEK